MSENFVSRRGRPATSPRLIAGLLYLQHAFDLSDEEVVWQWVENPYWQMFTGETYLQTQLPIDPSSLTRWRKRLGEAGVEALLSETIEAAKRANVIKSSSLKRVIVDTAGGDPERCPTADRRRGPWLQGCGHRWREDLSPGFATWHHAKPAGNDPATQCNRAGHRPYESRRQARSELAQRCAGRCHPCGAVRRRPQPADDPAQAAAFLRPDPCCLAQS
ncbi:hypothetical protein DFQ28_008702 [Apophysomyces sp. BC1034]|nr:hypothetical protein DFQ30_010615 [Apophysomyces sp. BC1015]KAG0192580.1 hypothetical protein DFQ28_008702 [Apophysomyces sp. BC1034]